MGNIKKLTVILREQKGKKVLEVKVWPRNVCLYCSKPLLDERRNSVMFFRSIHENCARELGDRRTGYELRGDI